MPSNFAIVNDGVIGVVLVVNKLIIFSAMTILPLIVKVVEIMEVIFGTICYRYSKKMLQQLKILKVNEKM